MSDAGSSEIGRLGEALLAAARDVAAVPPAVLGCGDCVRLSRKVSLLCHLFEEVVEFSAREEDPGSPSSSAPAPVAALEALLVAVRAVRRSVGPHGGSADSDEDRRKSAIQSQYVTWQLEKALGNLPYDYFEISDEVCEQVELVRVQLRRAIVNSDFQNLDLFPEIFNVFLYNSVEESQNQTSDGDVIYENENMGQVDDDVKEIVTLVAEVNAHCGYNVEQLISKLLKRRSPGHEDSSSSRNQDLNLSGVAKNTMDENKKPDSIPEDFRCPISLELMRDPVIVCTGQTYERASIQRWIDGGNKTCPKTQQKLENFSLTPNYALRSLIMQWCEANNFEQPHSSANGMLRKSDGSYIDVSGDRAVMEKLVCKLSSSSIEEQTASAAEIRSLAKRSTDNRILIAKAGAIPFLVKLLSVNDHKIQEHAVTAILNLSIYDNNKGLIILAGAVAPIIQVLRSGSMEARENAAAAIFSLSLVDENKITIGSTPGAIDELVELLHSGSVRGRKDAATALFNLCIYQGNKARAVRAGILAPLLKMLTDSSSICMVDEALTILSVLVGHQECRVAITKANMIPILIDLLRTVQPRNKENAAAVLLALCKKDRENLACIGRLGAFIPLTELAKSGTDRAKRKANSLLELLNRWQKL